MYIVVNSDGQVLRGPGRKEYNITDNEILVQIPDSHNLIGYPKSDLFFENEELVLKTESKKIAEYKIKIKEIIDQKILNNIQYVILNIAQVRDELQQLRYNIKNIADNSPTARQDIKLLLDGFLQLTEGN